MDPEIKIPEESDFYEPEPLKQVVDVKKQWYKFSPHNYMILDGLLFKITENNVDEMDTVLCIPMSKVHVLLEMYHSSVMGGHVGIMKCYQTIRDSIVPI